MGMQSLGQAMMRQDEIDQRQALIREERDANRAYQANREAQARIYE